MCYSSKIYIPWPGDLRCRWVPVVLYIGHKHIFSPPQAKSENIYFPVFLSIWSRKQKKILIELLVILCFCDTFVNSSPVEYVKQLTWSVQTRYILVDWSGTDVCNKYNVSPSKEETVIIDKLILINDNRCKTNWPNCWCLQCRPLKLVQTNSMWHDLFQITKEILSGLKGSSEVQFLPGRMSLSTWAFTFVLSIPVKERSKLANWTQSCLTSNISRDSGLWLSREKKTRSNFNFALSWMLPSVLIWKNNDKKIQLEKGNA